MQQKTPPRGKQRLSEWKNIDDAGYAYHLSQWQSQKQSTKHFSNFLGDAISNASKIMDLGCGAGAATFYLAQRHPQAIFVGVDYSKELISIANQLAFDKKANNLKFQTGDWFNLIRKDGVDGVISLQTLSWLPEFEKPLVEIFENLSPKWVALSSLFYEGDISCRIEVTEHSRNKLSFYNVYSIPAIARLSDKFGYRVSKKSKFIIDIDIKEPSNLDIMGTYTLLAQKEKGSRQERIQISGPILMNWYFVLIEQVGASDKSLG